MARIKVEKNIAYDDVKKLYYVTMDYGKDSQGKRVRQTKTFSKKSEAKKCLKEFEANKTKKTLVIPSEITLEEWLNYWLNDVKSIECEETTLYGYRNIINNHLIPALGNYKIQEITPMIINRYIKAKNEQGLSMNTIKKHYDLLKSALKQAVIEDKILKNPLDKVKHIKTERTEINCYNIEQLNKLFEIVENDRMEIVVKLAGLLGLRREEIAGLKWKNIDLDKKTIYISEVRVQAGKKIITKKTKTPSSKRLLYVPDEIIDLLIKIKNNQDEQKNILKTTYNKKGYVMAWENGDPYRPNYLSDLFKKIITDNNLPPIRLHDLRHSFASIANELGISIYDIGKILGHSRVETTEIYTHSFDKTHKDNIEKIADSIKKK